MALLFCLQGRLGKQWPGWKRRAYSSSSFPPLDFHLLLKRTQGVGGLSVRPSSLRLPFKGLPGFCCTDHLVPVSSQEVSTCSPGCSSLPRRGIWWGSLVLGWLCPWEAHMCHLNGTGNGLHARVPNLSASLPHLRTFKDFLSQKLAGFKTE